MEETRSGALRLAPILEDASQHYQSAVLFSRQGSRVYPRSTRRALVDARCIPPTAPCDEILGGVFRPVSSRSRRSLLPVALDKIGRRSARAHSTIARVTVRQAPSPRTFHARAFVPLDNRLPRVPSAHG